MGGDRGDYIDQRPDAQQPNQQLVADAQITPDSRLAARQTGQDRSSNDANAQTFMNADGTVTTKFHDGSSTRLDSSVRPPRVMEVDTPRGERTVFQYKDKDQTPSGFSHFDASGKEVERATKEKDGKPWKVEKADADGKLHKDKSAEVMDVRVGSDGGIVLVGKDGLLHERVRNGDQLTRFNDGTARVTEEKTWSGRTTSYTYNGQDTQPSSFTVKGADGKFAEHGVKTVDGWNVYTSHDGQGLNPQNLEDPANLVGDPSQRVTAVEMDQRTGKRVEVHADSSRTWQALDDDRTFRRNPDGSMTVVGKAQDASPRLLYVKDHGGVDTVYEYDQTGMLNGERTGGKNGAVHWMRQADTDTWRDEAGRTLNRKPEVAPDGSVSMTYPERKPGEGQLRLTQRPNGSEIVERIIDGQPRVMQTTDAHGKQTDFKYDDSFGALDAIKLTFPGGKQETWVRGDNNGQEVWTAGGKRMAASARIDADGSVVWTEGNRQVRADLSGIPIDISPKTTADAGKK